MTTNGTLLNKEIIKFLVENNIFITVSLDGPKNMHDRYRIFPNGRGTYDIIINNLKKIKDFSNEYFTNYISINSVLAPPFDFKKINNYFYQNQFLKLLRERYNFSNVDPYETKFFCDYDLENYIKYYFKTEINKLRRNYVNNIKNGNYEKLTFEKKFFDKTFYNIEYRKMDLLGDNYAPQGTCLPGQRRLFVDVNGRFFMCERFGSNYEIGNIEKGLNHNKIFEFLEKYVNFFKDCKYCWAIRLCNKCFNQIRKGENFDEQRKINFCKMSLLNIERNIQTYCEIKEMNADAFNMFDNYKIA